MALHPMLIHFPIAFIYLAGGGTFIGLFLYFFKNKLTKKEIEKIEQEDYLGKLDFTIFVSLLITLFGLLLVIYTGFLDAANEANTTLIDLVKPWEIITGLKMVLQSQLLIFKMVFAFTSLWLLILTLFLRHYYLRRTNVKSVFNLDTGSFLGIALLILTITGIITLVGSVGGTYVYGHSILQDIPIINLFLPTSYGFILVTAIVVIVLFVEIIILVIETKGMTKIIHPTMQ